MAIKQLLGARIKELRNKNNLTQSQLAERVGIDPKHQSCIENGKNFPSADLLEKFAKEFGIDSCVLLELTHNNSADYLQDYLINVIKNANPSELKLIYRVINSIVN